MAFGVLTDWLGLEPRTYQQMIEHMALGGHSFAAGYHFAGPIEGGMRIVDIWDSEELATRFMQAKLLPMLKALEITSVPQVSTWHVDDMLVPDMVAVLASRQRLVEAQDAERQRLERDLHDGAQQQLITLKVRLDVLAKETAAGQPALAAELTELGQRTEMAVESLRELARGLYPALLTDRGLVAALRARARTLSTPVRVVAEGVERYAQALEAAVYFCCLEALQNALKHARASEIVVRLSADGQVLRFVVEDDGGGFSVDAMHAGTGLQHLRDRLEAVAGRVTMRSSAGRGTTIEGEVPLAAHFYLPQVD